jgi:hypothetical protein
MQRILLRIQFVVRGPEKRTADKPSHCRVGCLVSPVGSIKYYRFTARKSGAAPEFALNVLKDMPFFYTVKEESLNARPVRTKRRPEKWLGSPDRAHQDLSMCIEKPPRAPYFRARAPQICHFINFTREFMPACPPCPN